MKRVWTTYFLIGGLALLLVALGVLQYHALTQISESDGEKAHRRVEEATEHFAADFNREIQNAYFNFQTDAETWKTNNWRPFNERYLYWRSKTAYPELISDFYFFEAKGDAPSLKYDREQQAFVPAGPSADLQDIRTRSLDEKEFKPFLPDLYTLVLPVHEAGPDIEKIVLKPAGANEPTIHKPAIYGFLAIRLNDAAFKEQILPDLAAKYFGDGEFRAAVLDEAGAAVFRSLNGDNRDAAAPLFTLSPDNFIEFKNKELLDSIGAERRSNVIVNSHVESRTFNRVSTEDGKQQTFKIELRSPDQPGATVLARKSLDDGEGPWTLAVQHSAGSIDAYVASTLKRNLAVGFGILLLLSGAVTAIIISSMRARLLAQRQLDFVSSVSHEFRTPLAVIYSAGENLADGVAKQQDQISGYGDLIKGEGKKLSAMVEQILEFAGARSGRQKYNLQPVAVGDVIGEAVSECRPLLDESGGEVEQNIADDLPPINADRRALSQAIQNLVANSIKYSSGKPRLRVAAGNGNGKVRISVEDSGIGIDKGDLKQIFEPFYRAKDVVDAQIHGNGLGLSLVKQIAEAHGGRVTAVSERGKGSTFTIELPQA